MFSHQLRYVFILILAAYSFANTIFSEAFSYYGIHVNSIVSFSCFFLICFLIWEGNRLLDHLLQKRISGKQTRIHPLIYFFLFSHVVSLIAASMVYFLVVIQVLDKAIIASLIPLKIVFLFSFRINLFLNCIHAILFLLRQYKKKEIEAEELRRISAMASLKAIRSQVNPHFLFNNLNVLSTLVMQKNEEANTFIEKFSTVYRYILKNQDTDMIKLKSELDFIKPYVFLLAKRYGDGLQVELEIPERFEEFYIVPVALQIVIENAIKHNVVSEKKPLLLNLFVDENDCLVIRNNLQPRKNKEPSEKTGLQNINQRLRLVSGKEIEVLHSENFFSVGIPLLKLE